MSLVGSYVVLQINPMAMVAGYVDPPLLAVARALGTNKYIALVQKELKIPAPAYAPHWRTYRITFVGAHKRGCSDECIPIFPYAHDTNRTNMVKPNMRFPFAPCCHWLSSEALIRVRTHPRLSTSHWTLSAEELRRFKILRKSGLNTEQISTPVPSSLRYEAGRVGNATPGPSQYKRHGAVFDRPPDFLSQLSREDDDIDDGGDGGEGSGRPTPVPRPVALPSAGRYSKRQGGVFTPTSASDHLSPMRRAQEEFLARDAASSPVSSSDRTQSPAVSVLFDRARRGHHEEVGDSTSEYSVTSTDASSLAEEHGRTPTVSSTLEYDDTNCDGVPLVDVSFDLREVQEIVNPNGFMEERAVVLQLVEKARARHRSEEALTMLSEPPPPLDPAKRIDMLVRVLSGQSAPTTLNSEGKRARRVLTRRPPAGLGARRQPFPPPTTADRSSTMRGPLEYSENRDDGYGISPTSIDARSEVVSLDEIRKRKFGVLRRSLRFVAKLYRIWIPSYKERNRKGGKSPSRRLSATMQLYS